jgi:hypothetical protein
MLLLLAIYFLSLCTLNPQVHAATLRHPVQTQRSSAGHCARPSPVPQATVPLPADHERTTEPLCCELRGAHNKALRTASVQTDTTPFLFFTLLPPDNGVLTREVQPLHIIWALHFSRPPPLYLLHAVLLI